MWKYATEQELARLSECYAVDSCKRHGGSSRDQDQSKGKTHTRLPSRILSEIFDQGGEQDTERNDFLLDFQFHNYSYPLTVHRQRSYCASRHLSIPFAFPCYSPGLSTFCRQQLFTAEQTSALLGICHTLMARDFAADSSTTLADSYAYFEALLLSHSVNRSPKRSVGHRYAAPMTPFD